MRHTEPEAGATGIDFTIRLEGVFDVDAAVRVREALAGGDPADAYALDLSRVRRFDDRAVALLAATLRGRRMPRLAVRGLRGHQLQMLWHLAGGEAWAVPEPLV